MQPSAPRGAARQSTNTADLEGQLPREGCRVMIPRVQEMRVAREGGLAPGWRPLAPTPQQQACRRSKRKRGGFPARYGRRSGAFGAGRAGRSYEAGSPRRRRLGRTTESQMGSDCRCWSRRLRWPARAGCDAHGSTSIRSAARTLEAAVARVRRREGAPWGAAEGAEYLTTIRAPSPHIGAGAGCGQDARPTRPRRILRNT